jgi:hypothetical protein
LAGIRDDPLRKMGNGHQQRQGGSACGIGASGISSNADREVALDSDSYSRNLHEVRKG